MSVEPIYHLSDVAERCGVPVDVVRGWIATGLRAVPLARTRAASGGPKPRDFLIREAWLIAYLDSKARIKIQAQSDEPAGKPVRRGRKAADRDSPLGPCPV